MNAAFRQALPATHKPFAVEHVHLFRFATTVEPH